MAQLVIAWAIALGALRLGEILPLRRAAGVRRFSARRAPQGGARRQRRPGASPAPRRRDTRSRAFSPSRSTSAESTYCTKRTALPSRKVQRWANAATARPLAQFAAAVVAEGDHAVAVGEKSSGTAAKPSQILRQA